MRYVEQPHLLYEEKLRGVGLFRLQKAEGESFQCFKESSEWGQVLFGGACEEYGEQQVQTRTQKRKFHLNLMKSFTLRMAEHCNRLPIACGVSSGDTQNQPGCFLV